MNSNDLFALALNLQTPWKIDTLSLDQNGRDVELHITIGFERGTHFPDENGDLCPVHDTQLRTWRHLNFFEHKAYLTCKVPRIRTPSGKVKSVALPWARKGSGFTLLFEAYTMALIENEMPFNKIGRMLNEDPHRIWTIFNYWITRAYAQDQPEEVVQLGFDETSSKKGHNYVTLGVDLEKRKVLHAVEGKDSAAIASIKSYLDDKGMDSTDIKHVSLDMSPSFISGVKEHFGGAQIHFDRFHVVKLLNEAMDTVRKLERKEHDELKGHKYTFLKNKDKLSKEKAQALSELIKLYPTLGEAYRLKILFNDLWEQEDPLLARLFLEDWFDQVNASGIEPFKSFMKTVKAHILGIISFCGSKINNGILEGINNKIQLAKRRARGYRDNKNFINMIYFLCGKLKFDYPQYSS